MEALTTDRARRPAVITLVATFSWMAAVVALLTGVSLLFPGTTLDRLWRLNPRAWAAFAHLGRASGGLLLVLCGLAAAAAVGLLRGRRWAWWLALGIFAANALGDAANLVITHAWLRAGSGIMIAGGFLLLLLRAEARRYFVPRS